MPSQLYPRSCMEILLFKEHFVFIHGDLSGQTHGCSKSSAAFDFYWIEREYRSSRESWQPAPLLSITSVQLFRENSDPPPPLSCFSLCNSMPLSSPGSVIGHTAGLLVETHGANPHQLSHRQNAPHWMSDLTVSLIYKLCYKSWLIVHVSASSALL